MADSARDRFLDKFGAALEAGTFVKLTLSEPVEEAEPDLRNVYVRIVELRDGLQVQFVYRHARRDVTKNVAVGDARRVLEEAVGYDFDRGYLFTTTGDWQWQGPGDGRLRAKRPSFTQQPSLEHDRPKVKAVAGAPWLAALGVTAPDGSARAGMADKLRQVERFTEVLGHLVSETPLAEAKTVRVADLGAGRGYLTFAAHTFFQTRGADVRTTGVEAREELVEGANHVAGQSGVTGLEFVTGEIASFQPEGPIDVLVALHACNTATDDALHLGIRSGAQLIVASPCCHQELRPQIVVPTVLEPMLRHGILLERHAENLTDAIRALLLEIHGYEARVFEFIAREHTGKNLMIAGRKRETPRDPEPLRAQLRDLLAFHGIREQRLASVLAEL